MIRWLTFQSLEPRFVFANSHFGFENGPSLGFYSNSLLSKNEIVSAEGEGPGPNFGNVLLDEVTWNGQASVSPDGSRVLYGDRTIPIDPTGSYMLRTTASGNDPAALHFAGYATLDNDRRHIDVYGYNAAAPNVDTTLAHSLQVGDTEIVLASALNWYAGSEVWRRSFISLNYRDSTGLSHGLEYSPTFFYNLWGQDAIHGNRITLQAPWSGPALPSGTPVRNTQGGYTFQYNLLSSQQLNTAPTQFTSNIVGTNASTTTDPTKLRPGTEYIQPLILANYYNAGPASNSTWSNFRVEATGNKLSVVENSPEGTSLGRVQAVGVEPLRFSLVSTNGPFRMDPVTGNITVASTAPLDFESLPVRALTVRVTDGTGLYSDRNFTVQIKDVNERIEGLVVSNLSVSKRTTVGATLGKVHAIDPDLHDLIKYSLVDSAQGRFAIDIDTGAIKLTGASPVTPFDTKITIKAIDYAGHIAQQDVTVAFDKDEGPLPNYVPTFNFRLPSQVYVNLGAFANVESAIASETNVDWNTQPDQATAITIAFAAKELRDHLATAGVPMSLIVGYSHISQVGIYLLTRNDSALIDELETRGIPIRFDNMHDQGFVIVENAGSLFLIGSSRIGCLYAAYSLLDSIGFKWFAPTESSVPNLSGNAIVPRLPIIEEPRQQYRGFWTFGNTSDRTESEVVVDQNYMLWMARNRLNLAGSVSSPYQHKFGIYNWGGGHHIIKDILDSPQLFAAHPNWYAEINGQRIPIKESDSDFYANPSFANNEMVAYVSNVLLCRLSQGDMREVDVLNLWPSDVRTAYNWDTSSNAILLGNLTDNLLNFYAGIGEHLAQAYASGAINRLVTIAGISYFLTWEPPTNPSIIARIEALTNYIQLFYTNERSYSGPINDRLNDSDQNKNIAANIRTWNQRVHIKFGVVDYLNYSIYSGVAVTASKTLGEDFEYYSENAGDLFAFMHPNRNNVGPRMLSNMLLAKLSWHVYDRDLFTYASRSATGVQDEYFSYSYAGESSKLKAIYKDIADATSNISEIGAYCTASIFQDFIWVPPPLSPAELAVQLNSCRAGGRRQLQDLPFQITFHAEFMGLSDSIATLVNAESRLRDLLESLPLSSSLRLRLVNEVAWIVTSIQRYQLTYFAIEYHLNTTPGSTQRGLIVGKITELAQSLLNNPLTADTISPLDQRSILRLFLRLQN